MSDAKLLVSASPHVRGPEDIPRIMWSVGIALLPALVAACLVFGWRAAAVTAVSAVFAAGAEYVIQKLRGVPVRVRDGSAVVAGMLLAFTLPPSVPLYVPAIGAIFAMAIAKHAFGGLGLNIWNPALAARAFLLASFPTHMVMSAWPRLTTILRGTITSPVDAVTAATPLQAMARGLPMETSVLDLVLGWMPGSTGETCALALAAGGIFLIVRGYVDWRVPAGFIGTVALLTFVLPARTAQGMTGWFSGNIAVHVFGGGLFLGAFFMATDMVTTPLTQRGQAVFAVGCGLLTSLIRLYGGYPEGVCYAILIMNTFTPLIDRFTAPRTFGGRPCPTT